MTSSADSFKGKERLIYKWGMVFLISIFAMAVVSFFFFKAFLFSYFVPNSENVSLFFLFRLLLVLSFPSCFLPASFLVELADSRINDRPYKLKNVLVFVIFLSEGIVIIIILLTLFDVLLSGISVFVQGPLSAVSIPVSIYVMVSTFRILKAHGYLRKTCG